MMPVMDGFTLLKKIKTNLEFSHIPIILLTAKNTLQSRMEGLELGRTLTSTNLSPWIYCLPK